jgi:pimeloyl-ACP methyl ester carboxylesterase
LVHIGALGGRRARAAASGYRRPVESFLDLPDGGRLAYDDAGSGRDVVLIHGMCMSRRYFDRNVGPLAERFRVVNVDLRSHGESPISEGKNSVAQFAADVQHLIGALELKRPVLVGWSMGSFVVWDLIRQFGADGLAGHVNVSQGPTDLAPDGWDHGVFPLDAVLGFVGGAQADYRTTMEHVIPLMLKDEPSTADAAWMLDETQKIGANAGALVALDQFLVDYRDVVSTYDLPTLLCFGRDEKLIKASNADWLAANQRNATIAWFEESGHCPMWEEPAKFNQVVGDWIAAL